MELGLHPTLQIVKPPKTESDIDKYLLKTGRCPKCKMQTHERRGSMFNRTLVPLTNKEVLNGRCLLCHPIGGGDKPPPADPSQKRPPPSSSSGSADAGSAGGSTSSSSAFQGGGGPGRPQARVSWGKPSETYWHDWYLDQQQQQQQQEAGGPPTDGADDEPDIAVPPSSSEGELPGGTARDRRKSGGGGAPAWLDIDDAAAPSGGPSTSLPPGSSAPAAAAPPPPRPYVPSRSSAPTISDGTKAFVPQATAAKRPPPSPEETFVPDVPEAPAEKAPSAEAKRKRYPDGVYEGSLSSSGQRSGYGVMTYDNGDVHVGEWKLDVRSGRGRLTDAEGNVAEGTWEHGEMNGHGAFRLRNGCEYVGNIADGSWNGAGTYRSAEGDRYSGPFRDGEFHGPGGIMRYADGNSYVGDWVCGIRDGRGTFTWSDGEVELSSYAGHVRDGRGVRFSADGGTAWELIDGDLRGEITIEEARRIADGLGLEVPKNVPKTSLSRSSNNVERAFQQNAPPPQSEEDGNSSLPFSNSEGYKHPYLRRRFKNRSSLSSGEPDLIAPGDDTIPSNIKVKYLPLGTFRGHLNQSDQREGQGIMNYNDGSQYSGSWRADMRHGRGTHRWPDGSSYVGEWADDEMSGRGKRTYRNGDTYEGEFRSSKLHGRGTYRCADGTASVLCYVDDVPVGTGARWSADGTEAFALREGRIRERVAPEDAEGIARRLGLAVPAAAAGKAAAPSRRPDGAPGDGAPSVGGFAPGSSVPAAPRAPDAEPERGERRLVGASEAREDDGEEGARRTKKFRMGTYEGQLNARGEREGRGTMRYNSGAQFVGEWRDDRKALGYSRSSGGNLYVGEFRSHQKFGEGAEWSSNGTKVWRVVDGLRQGEIGLEEAQKILERLGLEMPAG